MEKRTQYLPPTPLSPELELEVLSAALQDKLPLDLVRPEECSKSGRALLEAKRSLGTGVLAREVFLLAAEKGFAPREELRTLAKDASTHVPAAVESVLAKLGERRRVLQLLQTANEQLRTGNFSAEGLLESAGVAGATPEPLVAIADQIKDGLPPVPEGAAIRTLPVLAEKCGGIFGVWVIGGMPKVGKSTLAWQLALDAGRSMPVIYYDFENGLPTLLARTARVFDGDLGRIREATANVYHRRNIRTLSADLAAIKPPAIVAVDSLQAIPFVGEDRRAGLDRWVRRLESLKDRGYHVLMVSELNRAAYGQEPSLGGFKETGEIEYAADCGIHTVLAGDYVYLYVVAHRHRPTRGLVCTLARQREWWYKEVQ